MQCDGLLVGRVGRRDGRALLRLGRVARRLLRHLPAPVMVVPPDLPRTDVGRGPLILATDLTHHSANAAATAARLAKELRRGLLVVHVEDVWQSTPPLVFEGLGMVPPVPGKKVGDVAAWARAHGLATAEPRLASGGVVESLLALATDEDAPVLICGSRRLDLAERIFVSSTATELARLADRAVLVVPASAQGA
jgi:nucleotide-binding universal stress UspA family protein